MTNLQRKHAGISSAGLLLFLLQLAHTSGLQQGPTFAAVGQPSISSLTRKQPACARWPLANSLFVTTATSVETSDLTQNDDSHSQPIAYDWDEQFEELQKFNSEYGHCNFPQNPSKELKLNYPMLERFCRDQRREYQLLQKYAQRCGRMTLVVFDRKLRCRQLEQLGFEFNSHVAQWYDSYHELIEYSNVNGHTRVTRSENDCLATWIYQQRTRRNGAKGQTELSDFQIKLLDDIGFEWESQLNDAIWNEKYEELVAFRNKHGSFMMMEASSTLYNWMTHQRRRRVGTKGLSALSDEQIRLLDEIEFPWEPYRYDSMWLAMYDELKKFHEEYGHCRPVYSTHLKLYKWAFDQKVKHQGGLLSSDQIKLLDEIDFPWERKKTEWPMMLSKLVEHCNTHGNIQISQEDDPGLCDWMEIQRRRYQGKTKDALSDEQIERLEDLHFCWSLEWRDRVWHEKYTEAVEYFKKHGHVSVTENENPSLYNWIQTQEKRYKGTEGQKPLSEQELEMLEHLDFPFLEGQRRMAWNHMYAKVTKYREENDGRLPTSHKDDPDLSCWLRHQRYRYRSAFGYAPLSDEQMGFLQSIDFPRYPKGKLIRRWYEKYDEPVGFWKKHGHFLVDRSENRSLSLWIGRQRMSYNGSSYRETPLSKLQVYLLDRIGFPWTSDRNEIEWQQHYEELVEFLETQGRFPTKSDDKRLFYWLNNQRTRYKGTGTYTQLSESQIQQLEKVDFPQNQIAKDCTIG